MKPAIDHDVDAIDAQIEELRHKRLDHEQDDQLIAVLDQIETISRPPIDPILAKSAADPFDVRQIAQFHAEDGGCHLGRSLDIEIVKPPPERAGAILADILLDNHTTPSSVTYSLPSV